MITTQYRKAGLGPENTYFPTPAVTLVCRKANIKSTSAKHGTLPKDENGDADNGDFNLASIRSMLLYLEGHAC